MEIKVLGTGCYRCRDLLKTAEQAVLELGIDAQIEKVQDMDKILSYGVSRTPGLVIDGKVVLSGRLPDVEEVKRLLKERI